MSTLEVCLQVLQSDFKTRDASTVADVLAKLGTFTDSDDRNRTEVTPYLGRVVTTMTLHTSNARVVREGMQLIRFICRNDDSSAAMNVHIIDVVTMLQQHASNAEVICLFV